LCENSKSKFLKNAIVKNFNFAEKSYKLDFNKKFKKMEKKISTLTKILKI
jgi:hypothetical protein